MKIGVGSYAYRWSVGTRDFVPTHPLTLEDFVRKSKQAGADVIQICDNLFPEKQDKDRLIKLEQLSKDLDIMLEVGFKGGLNHFSHLLSVASLLDSKLVRLVVDDPEWKPVNKFADKLSEIAPDLHAAKIMLAIENHFLHTPQELIAVIEKVNDPFIRVCLDPFNSISQLVSPKTTIDLMAPYAISVHVKDVVVKRYNTGFYIQGCPLGQGLLDVNDFLNSIKRYNLSPNIFIEGWLDRLDSEHETIKKEQEWIVQGIEYLRRLV